MDKWLKYNDIYVTEVDWQTVFTNSLGGKGLASAYCLLYVNSEVQGELAYASLHQLYRNLIPRNLEADIQVENHKFREEV